MVLLGSEAYKQNTDTVEYVLTVMGHLGYTRDRSILLTNRAIKKNFTGEVAVEVSLEGRMRVYQEKR